jgi:hypothetical protein
MKQDNNGQIPTWTPPANEGDVPKWVQKIRLYPEVTSSYIQMVKLNPLKDYVVTDQEDRQYWVFNEEGISVSVNKCLAYEVNRPAVSSLSKALVQLSKRKFVAGTMVKCLWGEQYTTFDSMAEKLSLNNYTKGYSISKGGTEGMVLSCYDKKYGVRVNGVDCIFGEGGLEAIHNV